MITKMKILWLNKLIMKDSSRTLYKSKSLKHFTNDSMIDTINS